MGAKLFAWLGGFAAFLGAAFFVKYSFEHDLIPPEVRVALGFIFGLGLVIAGLVIARTRYAITAQTLCATGIVTLYAVTFACNSVYHFAVFEPPATFLLMALITAAAFGLAVRLDARVVAILGLLGGFVTPVLLSTGHDNATGLFGYIALLDLGLIAVALRQRWQFLVPLGATGTGLMLIAWASKFLRAGTSPTAMVVCLGFGALFLGGYFVARRLDRASPSVIWSAVVFPFIAFALAPALMSFTAVAAQPGQLFGFVLLADAGLLALEWCEEKLPKLHLIAGGVVFGLLAGWTSTRLTTELLPWALAFCLGHAVLHTAFPLLLERHRPAAGSPKWWRPVFPPQALLPFLLLILMTQRLPLTDPSPVFGLALLLVVMVLGLTTVLGGSNPDAGASSLAMADGTSPASRLLQLAPTFRTGVAWLPACALAGVVALEYVWHTRHFAAEAAFGPFAWYLVSYAVFAVYPFVFRRRFAPQTGPWAIAALSGVVHFPLVHRVVRTVWPGDFPGLVPALFAVPALVSLLVIWRAPAANERARLNQIAWFGAVALLFITLIFPIQLKRQWLTVGWALEGAALLWLFRRVPHPGLRGTGIVLLVAAFVRLALNPAVLSYHPSSGTAVLNWYLYTYGLVTACLFVGARLLARPAGGEPDAAGAEPMPPRAGVWGMDARPLLSALGTVLAFLLLNIEIADFFSVPGSRVLTFQFSGDFARDMTYTIAWALFALGLLLIGIWKKIRAGRRAALMLLGVALLKLFLHDLARLEALYRIGALFAVAAIAILASVAYQRFLPGAEKNPTEKP